jgi:hypothetical protein
MRIRLREQLDDRLFSEIARTFSQDLIIGDVNFGLFCSNVIIHLEQSIKRANKSSWTCHISYIVSTMGE